MARGIIITGSSGSGKTTLGQEVANQLGYEYFDIDDYIYRFDVEVPYTVMYPREERISRLMGDISKFPHFVMAGSMNSFNAPFVPLFDLAVYHTAPAEIRAERYQSRAIARWGDRVLPGGDMYEINCDGILMVHQYDVPGAKYEKQSMHEQWLATLPCPVLRTDGTLPVAENATRIVAYYKTCSQ
ncbi:MAG: shikimate kinase [Oscillospiraceae bacterium]|nr:shikimate kinase [Oscillospiraceae bacterium]